ncbi:MAG TPA: hypothetical protein PLV68_12380, partial [Ilumatobacteraceae bacterium]|nr:hypothetical protein [Ilumatobacteraceae bacterium]
RVTAVVVVGMIVIVAPWAIRNEVKIGAFIPFSTNLGDTMCMARFPGSDSRFHWADHEWCADPALPAHIRSN